MATTEIEKLERRYADNPQGLTFAPLAEIYRKNGDTARALELLQAGLELHPNYIPASIVLGRCHWDTGDLPAAEAAFAHVLRLDDENVIALKSLADVNERLGRPADAQRWLNRLLSIDRSNEEARQQLARLEEARHQPSPAAAEPAKPTDAEPKPSATAEPTKAALTAEPAQPAPAGEAANATAAMQTAGQREQPPVEPAHIPPKAIAEPASLDLTAAILEPATRAAPEPGEPTGPTSGLQFLDTSEAASQTGESAATAGVTEEQTSSESAPVPGLIVQEFVPPPADAGYRSHPELAQEFASAGPPSDELEVETVEEVELQSSGAAEFRVPNAAEELMAPLDLAPPGSPAPGPVAPEPPSAEPISHPPEPMPAKRRSSYSVRETRGRSVAEYFQTMLASRPAGTPRFVDGTSAHTSPGEVPSTPAGGDQTAAPSAPGNGAGDVSFDDFFGAPSGEKSSLPKGSSDPGKDDLDQFQSWLQNLKR